MKIQSISNQTEILNNRELDQLCRFAATLGTTLDVDTLIDDSLEPLMSMAAANRIMIALSNSESRLLVPVASLKWKLTYPAKGIPAPTVATLGTEAKTFNNISDLPHPLASKLGDAPGSIAVVPLWAHAHLRGIIILQREKIPFSDHTLKLLTASGRQLALAVENSQLLSDLQDSYRKLMNTQEELIRSERLAALGQLSATMAHEIRNPLATIFSALSQIRKNCNAEGITKTLLDIADEEAIRLNKMVSGLLEFARPRKAVFENSKLLDLVADVVKNTRKTVDPDNANIKITIATNSLNPLVKLDRDLFYRALDLLLSNAIWAIANCEQKELLGNIDISISKDSQQHGIIILSVKDTGIGISSELLSKVCDPFFSTKPSGIGLGLSTVKRIIEDHNGIMKIISQPGTGTHIQLFLKTINENLSLEEVKKEIEK